MKAEVEKSTQDKGLLWRVYTDQSLFSKGVHNITAVFRIPLYSLCFLYDVFILPRKDLEITRNRSRKQIKKHAQQNKLRFNVSITLNYKD